MPFDIALKKDSKQKHWMLLFFILLVANRKTLKIIPAKRIARPMPISLGGRHDI